MQIVVDNLLVNYQRQGAGKTLLIIPGWADTSASWRQVQNDLAVNFEIIVIDLPGFGGSQPPNEAWGLNDYALFIDRFLNKVAVKIYAVVGHSNGGAIAIHGLASRVLEPERLILLASAGIRDDKKVQKNASLVIAKAGKLVSAPLPDAVRKKLRRKLYKSVGSDMLVAEHMQETFKKIIGEDIQKDAHQISVPTLLIYGESDPATPVKYGQMLAGSINNSKLLVAPGAGHFLQQDCPAYIVDHIKDFLGEAS